MKVAVTFRSFNDSTRKKLDPYEQAIRGAGLDPVFVTPNERQPIDGFRGLVLTGGADINPACYGEPNQGSEGVDPARDRLEMDLLAAAIEKDLPVLAICRGVQLLNVFHGGSLIQDLPSKDIHEQRRREWEPGRHPAAHVVDIEPGSRLAQIVGSTKLEVNSRHHQAADRVGAGLTVTARSADGVIEGLENPDRRFVVGVQWHPEDRVLVSEADQNLFAAFAEALGRDS